MTVYSYKATDQNGKYVEGDINAPDYKDAIQQIRKLNYFPVKVSEGKIFRSSHLLYASPFQAGALLSPIKN